ncbi:hypothetical protein MD484_g9101, partial [Candolleomyces efflorescens]
MPPIEFWREHRQMAERTLTPAEVFNSTGASLADVSESAKVSQSPAPSSAEAFNLADASTPAEVTGSPLAEVATPTVPVPADLQTPKFGILAPEDTDGAGMSTPGPSNNPGGQSREVSEAELSALSVKLGNFNIETALLSPTNPSSGTGAISPAVVVYASSRPTSVETTKATEKCLAVSRIYEGRVSMSPTPSRQNHPPQDEDFELYSDEDFELYSRERSRPGSPMTQDIEFLGGLGGDGEGSYDIYMEPSKLGDEYLSDDLDQTGSDCPYHWGWPSLADMLNPELLNLGGSESPAASQAAINESLEDNLFDLGGSESPATWRVPIDESLEDDLFDLGGSESPAAIDESLADDLFDLGGSESPAASRAAIDESLADDLFDLGDSNGSPRPLINDSLGVDMFDVGTNHSPPPIESLADDLFDLGSQTSSAHIDESLTDELFNLGSSDGAAAPKRRTNEASSLADDLFDLGSSQSRAASELSSEDKASVNVPNALHQYSFLSAVLKTLVQLDGILEEEVIKLADQM